MRWTSKEIINKLTPSLYFFSPSYYIVKAGEDLSTHLLTPANFLFLLYNVKS